MKGTGTHEIKAFLHQYMSERGYQLHQYPGTFIVIEGADGAGTTTQSEKLADHLDAHWTHEPADNAVGEKVDEMISDGSYTGEAIALAFAADRKIHLEEEIIPRLEAGETVVCDRYYHSSYVYQTAMGVEEDWIQELNRYAITPDITILLDIDPDVALERLDDRESLDFFDKSDGSGSQLTLNQWSQGENIFENLSFQDKVILGYRRLAANLGDQARVVDGAESIETVFENILAELRKRDLL